MYLIRKDNQYLLYEVDGAPVMTHPCEREGSLMDHRRLAKRYPSIIHVMAVVRELGPEYVIEEVL